MKSLCSKAVISLLICASMSISAAAQVIAAGGSSKKGSSDKKEEKARLQTPDFAQRRNIQARRHRRIYHSL